MQCKDECEQVLRLNKVVVLTESKTKKEKHSKISLLSYILSIGLPKLSISYKRMYVFREKSFGKQL